MKTINSTQLIKETEIKQILNKFINKINIEKFNIIIKPKHKSYMLMGTASDYMIRREILIKTKDFPLKDELICEKSIEILKKQDKLSLISHFDIEKSIKNYKNKNNFDNLYESILNMARLDSYYRRGFFDEIFGFPNKQELTQDLTNIKDNFTNNLLNSLLINYKWYSLNPIFGQIINKNLIIQGDGDLLIDENLIEIKTSISPDVKKEYIYQTLIYSFLYERTNKDKKINYITFLNPRASNIIKIPLDKIVDNWSLLKKELEKTK